MTEKTQPTDAELMDLGHECELDAIEFGRAVLAKWGQPAHSGEPVAWKHDCAALLTNDVELWIDACPHCGKPRNAPQPVERVPLTDGLEMALEQLVNRCNNGHDSSTWDEVIAAEAALERLYKSRAIEAAHGIKGGQHGTE